MPPSIPPKRVLASKEATLFKELLTFYETRQLKKGIKTADSILKKNPEHGETTCMKGLLLTHLGRREEGIELVKKGLRLDLTSHICWHVFGLIQKGEKDYEGTLKSYTQALKFDKENMNILRDAAHIQTQLRQFEGLVESRYTLLRIRPNLRQNWIGLSVAYYLSGNLKESLKILDHYEETLKNVPNFDPEHSETLLYHIRVLEELGETAQALTKLDTNSKARAIVDRTAIMETRARLLTTQSSPNAQQAWNDLIERNPNCLDYYYGLLKCQGLDLSTITDENRAQALAVLKECSAQQPKASTPRRLALTLASGDEFTPLAREYILSGLTRGIPSLYTDVKSLYSDPQKQEAVETIVLDALQSFSPSQASTSSEPKPDPTHYLWALFFLGEHFSRSNPQKALEYIGQAIEHTPTLPELYTLKARTLKRVGDVAGGVVAMEEARDLDGQDRFLNTKCWKYWMRASSEGVKLDCAERASEIAGLFTKKDAPSPGSDLEDMQSTLFILEEAAAHRRSRKLGPALKKYMAIVKIFGEFEDDQFDFHGYSIRKFTVNMYLNMIDWEDKLRSHPAYITAAVDAARIYVELHDDPSLKSSSDANSQLSDAAKKAKSKAQKAAQKAKNQEEKKPSTQTSANEDKGLEPQAAKDEDPDGSKLLTCTDPLDRAAKLLAPLIPQLETGAITGNWAIDAWSVVYDVAVRRGKWLLAFKALAQARKLDQEDPRVHLRVVDICHRASTRSQDFEEDIKPVMTAFLSSLRPSEDISLDTFNSQYLQRHSTSVSAILGVAKAQAVLGAEKSVLEATIFSAVENPDVRPDWKATLACLDLLKSIKSERADEFRALCAEKLPLSSVFRPKEEIEAVLKTALNLPKHGGDSEKLEVKE